ncbi:hypothetical protein BDL97_14G068900 [Sphagnum fallax]|nr:hypothetical protein BDL97_14G068900 [Sphagnum fallax]
MAAAISQEFAEPIRRHDDSSLAGSSSSFRLGRSSSVRRASSFGREVVIPALKRQGSTTVSSSRSLYREAALMTQPSCFGSWRWTTTTTTTAATGGPESPTSNLLRNTDDHGASAAPDSSSGSVLDEQARDARTAAAAAFGRLLSSRSMSLLQSRSSGAWSKKSSRRESSAAAAAAAQWTVAAGRSAGEEIANLERSMSFKPAPMWKRMLKKLCANAKQHMIIVHPVSAREWTNYDAQSYAKNFDNGERWRDDQTDSNSSSSSSSFFSMQSEEDSEEQEQLRHELGLRETALHTALLQKFHSTRYDSSSTAAAAAAIDSFRATGASSMPVNPVRPYQPRQDIVPLWQRRNVRPPSKLQLTCR